MATVDMKEDFLAQVALEVSLKKKSLCREGQAAQADAEVESVLRVQAAARRS